MPHAPHSSATARVVDAGTDAFGTARWEAGCCVLRSSSLLGQPVRCEGRISAKTARSRVQHDRKIGNKNRQWTCGAIWMPSGKGWWITLVAVLLRGGRRDTADGSCGPGVREHGHVFRVDPVRRGRGRRCRLTSFAQQRVVSYAALPTSDKLARKILATAKPTIDLSVSQVSKEIGLQR